MRGISHIYYRGELKSCNYDCFYCPFRKSIGTEKELKKDREALEKFIEWVIQTEVKNPISILFTPFGEAMIHPYYQRAMGKLSHSNMVSAISCQTNLSFSVESFFSELEKEGADFKKIYLWASFHPTMVETEVFAEQVLKLSKKINLCVGTVGDSTVIDKIETLKKKLPKEVYLWVNKMDGLNRAYTEREIRKFTDIDPLFPLELKRYPCEINGCQGGRESIFITGDGNISACNRHKEILGNLYETEKWAFPTDGKGKCDCFLAYCNRRDLDRLELLGRHRQLRCKETLHPEAVFFDIDGTLVHGKTVIEADMAEVIRTLSKKTKVYFATGLPINIAKKKCELIWDCIAGGAFAYGGELWDREKSYHKTYFLDESLKLPEKGFHIYRRDGQPYKILGRTKPADEIEKREQVIKEDDWWSVVSAKAGKVNGILELCRQNSYDEERIVVVGNGKEDVPMLSYFKNSIAVPEALGEAKEKAAYVLAVKDIKKLME